MTYSPSDTFIELSLDCIDAKLATFPLLFNLAYRFSALLFLELDLKPKHKATFSLTPS